MQVRVRFAPSPTGYLHIGGARTALFNWLYARQTGGTFILRIEDTDAERSSREMVEGIIQGLTWLGLEWDEGPIHQSRRLELYRSVAGRLLDAGKAFRCFCPPSSQEEFRGERCACRELPAAEGDRRAGEQEGFAIRFRVPEGEVSFEDRVFGPVQVRAETLEDFVLLRSDGTPTYHLSVVADDLEMRVSHVIRGADHLSNTGKHVLLYKALDRPVPLHAHLPLILGPDKKRLSKRHGATSVLEYQQQGFLPSAVRNYLALLGWSPGDDRELMSDQELIESFSLERINKANAVFDLRKLEWLNGQKLSATAPEELQAEVLRVLSEHGLEGERPGSQARRQFLETIELLKRGARRLTDFATLYRAFFSDDFAYEERGIQKYLRFESLEAERDTLAALGELQGAYRKLPEFDLPSSEAVLREIVERKGLHTGKFIGAVRVALTGQPVAPSIFEVIVLLGRERTLQRLQRAIQFVQSREPQRGSRQG